MGKQKPDRLGGERVGEDLMARGIDRFDRMVERPHTGRDPQPVGRFDRQGRIVDDDRGLQPRIDHAALDAGFLVGGSASRRVFGGRQGGWDRDMQKRLLGSARRKRLRPIELAAVKRHVAPVEDRGDRDLAGVDRAAAAEAHDRVGIVPTQLLGEGTHRCIGTCWEMPLNTPAQRAPSALVT